MALPRTNPWSLEAILARDARSKSDVARDAEIAPSTLTGLLSGRRGGRAEVVDRLAVVLDVDPRALSADPYGVLPYYEAVERAAERLVPHLANGGELRAALIDLRRARP